MASHREHGEHVSAAPARPVAGRRVARGLAEGLLAAVLATAGATGATQAFRVQSAEDAAALLARLAFLEDRCAATTAANRPGLAELVRSDGTDTLRAAEHTAIERRVSRDGPEAVCAALAATPGLGASLPPDKPRR